MIVDAVLTYLCTKKAANEWTGFYELTEIIQQFGLPDKEATEIVDFLEKYFMEADESKQKLKLPAWTYNLFESPSV